jgi:hypothetical protein
MAGGHHLTSQILPEYAAERKLFWTLEPKDDFIKSTAGQSRNQNLATT